MISEISNAGGFTSPAEFRKERFKKLDQNGDGGIDKSELQAVSEKRGQNKKGPNIDEIFDKVDINHDGVIDESENDKAMAEFEQRAKSLNQPPSTAEFRKEMFKKLDQDGNGGIDKSELQAVSKKEGSHKTKPNTDEIFAKIDTNHDGVIDESENDAAMAEFEQAAKDQSEVRAHQSISLLGVKNQEQHDLWSKSSRLELLLAQLNQSTDNYTGDEAERSSSEPSEALFSLVV
jgi:Ca2+-binding EF-hand superfamily protein